MYALYKQNIEPKTHYAMTALGDDNLVIFQSIVAKLNFKSEAFVQTLRKLGFDPKFKLKDTFQKIEFCSGIFVPVLINQEITFCLVPKPIRWLSKIGMTINKLHKNETCEDRILSILKGQAHLEKIHYFKPYFKLIRRLTKKDIESAQAIFDKYDTCFYTSLLFDVDKEYISEHCEDRYGVSLEDVELALETDYNKISKINTAYKISPIVAKMAAVDIVGDDGVEINIY